MSTSILHPRPVREMIAESPLVPVALGATAGLLVDRYVRPALVVELVFLAGALMAGTILLRQRVRLAPLAFSVAVGAVAALYHHSYRHVFRSDDIGDYATAEPKLVRLRGVLEEEPTPFRVPRGDPLASFLRPDPTRTVLRVNEVLAEGGWVTASGKAHVTVEDRLPDLHAGDEVEVFGWLNRPAGPANPGGFDWAEHLRDQRIRAEVRVRRTSGGVVRLAEGWTANAWGWLARLRGWGQRLCERELPPEQAGVASALLLGEGSAMTTADWDKYVHTGVIHVLAISGQHLVVLAVFFGLALRLAGAPRRASALTVAGFLIAYALLTGFRPPVQRAAITAGIACLAVFLRRVPLPANTFALAWLAIIAFNPTDIFGMGCQLSFLQVAILTWGVSRLLDPGESDPLDHLIDQSRSSTERLLRAGGRILVQLYFITLVLGLAALPLVAARQNIVSLSGFVIGPPVVILTSIALIAGFLMLLAAPFGLAAPFAWLTRWTLEGCERLVDLAGNTSYGHFYVSGVPEWWLWGFYLGILALLWCRPCWPRRNWFGLGAAVWAALGLLVPTLHLGADDLRVTFLSVGHGGCTVLETPDGRVLVYDAGAMGGPEVTRRHIAPFLWSRGHRRVDELLLSHADLDHFNGVTALLERFEVGLVTCTPSFADKDLPGVRHTLAAIRRRGVPVRIVHAGSQLTSGDVTLDVLHPPAEGPEGNENVRSLVLRVRHRGHTILLTGDLESTGLDRVIAGEDGRTDVLMSPHHGSPSANTRALARWARPWLVIACDARSRRPRPDDPYAEIHAEYWTTGVEGAVTVRSHATGLIAETFRTGRRLVVRAGSEP